MVCCGMRRGMPGLRLLQQAVAANIRLLRRTKGISQEELSSGAGLAVRHLQKTKIRGQELQIKLVSKASTEAPGSAPRLRKTSAAAEKPFDRFGPGSKKPYKKG